VYSGRARDCLFWWRRRFTGLRRGELAKIEWRDVNVDEAKPFISVRFLDCEERKSGSPSRITRRLVAAALRQCRRGDVAPHDLCFQTIDVRHEWFFGDDLQA